MKKLVAVLMCSMMMLSLFSCRTNDQKGKEPVTTTETTPPLSDHIAMEMYEAAINDEICVFDEHLGEIELKSLRLPSNNTRLDKCKLLTKAILDLDGDGINEYVIQSPNNDLIILHYYNGKVYSYCLEVCDYYKLNTDGTVYWYQSSVAGGYECGLNKIIFDEKVLNTKSLYSLKYSENPTKYEYFVEGAAVTEREYDTYRAHNIHKEKMKFSQFELTCSYPITAEQAWILANAYWDNQDGCREQSAGTIWTARIVLVDTPKFETDAYRIAFQVEWNSGGGLEGYECMPPHSIREHDQILVNAFTGEITASSYDPNGKVLSVEEAIEIAKKHCEPNRDEYGYRYEHAVNEPAPDHIYVIVVQKFNNGHDSFYTRMWIDKYTGEIVFGYYMYGK